MRLLCAVVLAGALMGGLAALWVLDHQRLRHDYFVARRATAGAVTAVRDASAANQGVGETFKITGANGLAVRLRVLRSPASDAPQPLIVVLGGYGTGRDAVRLVGDPGEFAVVAMDYPYDGPDRIRGWAQAIYHWPAIQQALLDTPPALSIVLDWLQA